VKALPSLRACGARPSRGMSQGEVALRGRAGDSAKGGFLGGARSARPRGEAGRKPKRVMIAGGKRRTEGPGETCPGEADSVPAGVRSPPLQAGQAGEKAYWGKARDGAEGVFVGGARSPRPGGKAVRRPRDFIPTGWLPTTRWPTGDMPWWSRWCNCGRAEPAPPGGGLSKLGRPCGGSPEITRGAIFSEGRGLRAREYGPSAS